MKRFWEWYYTKKGYSVVKEHKQEKIGLFKRSKTMISNVRPIKIIIVSLIALSMPIIVILIVLGHHDIAAWVGLSSAMFSFVYDKVEKSRDKYVYKTIKKWDKEIDNDKEV